jgi:hypothetical protein
MSWGYSAERCLRWTDASFRRTLPRSGAEPKRSGVVADVRFRKRDPRFKTADRHKPNKDKTNKNFTPKDFIHDGKNLTCICPAGKRLYLKQRRVVIRGYQAVCFMGAKRDCGTLRPEESVFKRSQSKHHTASVLLYESIGDASGNLYGQDEAEN